VKRNLGLIVLVVVVLCLFVVVTGCQKAPEEKPNNASSSGNMTEILGKENNANEKTDEWQKGTTEKPSLGTSELEKVEENPNKETQETKIAIKGPLTEEEQDYFDKVGGDIHEPDYELKGVDLLKYISILMKGNISNIRWYREHPATKELQMMDYGKVIDPEERQQEWYETSMGLAISMLDLKNNKEALKLVKEILKTKSNMTDAVGYSVNALGFTNDTSVIPLLREFTGYPNSGVRLATARSLLRLGDRDTALPILKKFIEDGSITAVDDLFDREGELLDERGKAILVAALDNPRAEVAMTAAKHLYEMGIARDKCEKAALTILKKYINKKNKDYGFEITGGPSNPKWVLLPAYKDKNLNELEGEFASDFRACSYAATLLGKLKSAQAVPLLEYMKKNNTDPECVCWENAADRAAERALENIKGDSK
jgi:hypothetical protein